MRKILITGGAGNIGSALTKKLLEDHNNFVIVVDNLLTGSKSKIPFDNNPHFKFIKADVNDYADISAIMLSYHFDVVFHYAALVGVQRTLDNPVKVLNDIKGIENVLKLCKNTGVQRVFYSSSSEVYGEPVEYPQNEHTTPLNSRLPYAIVKNLGEAFLKSFHQEYGLNYTIFRFFNTYGPNQSKDFVIVKFLNAALANKDITIYGDGSQTRTFLYIDDNVHVASQLLNENLFVNDILNLGSDLETTILELAELIIEMTNSSSKIIHLPPLEEGDMTRRQPSIEKMKSVLKKDYTPLRDGLQKLIDHTKANR